MAATSQSPANQQASNVTLGAPITVGILLLIIVLGYLTYRFHPKSTSSILARPPYRGDIRLEDRIGARYLTLEGIPVLQYDSKIHVEHHEIKLGPKVGGKTHEEMGLQVDEMETRTLATTERDQETATGTWIDPAKMLRSQSPEYISGVGVEDHSPQSSSQPQPQPPRAFQASTSTQQKNKTSEEEGSATCSICVSHLRAGENIRILPCGNNHIYHRRCIDPWLLDFAWRCPLCRVTLPVYPTSLTRSVTPPERAHLSG